MMGKAVLDINAPAADGFTMIGIVEFARGMGVCTNTVRTWIETGQLVTGVHYMLNGRVLRFPWDRESVKLLMMALSSTPSPPRPRLRSLKGNRNRIKLKC